MAVKKEVSVPKHRFAALDSHGYVIGEICRSIDEALLQYQDVYGEMPKSGVNVYELVSVGKYTGKMVIEKVG